MSHGATRGTLHKNIVPRRNQEAEAGRTVAKFRFRPVVSASTYLASEFAGRCNRGVPTPSYYVEYRQLWAQSKPKSKYCMYKYSIFTGRMYWRWAAQPSRPAGLARAGLYYVQFWIRPTRAEERLAYEATRRATQKGLTSRALQRGYRMILVWKFWA